MRCAVLLVLLFGPAAAVLAVAAEGPIGDRLAAAVAIEADGKPIDLEQCVLVPFVGDIDGDGKPDLLVGTRDKGRLLVYRNVGTAARPRLAAPQWFDDAGPTGRVPGG
jgi:hypothetical protein